jgi:hypothetical protein
MNKFLFKLTIPTAAAVFLAVLIWSGCTKSPTSMESSNDITSANITTYFPLTSGSNLDFRVIDNTTNDTTRQRYTIGDRLNYSSSQVVLTWISFNIDQPFHVDTGYFCLDDDVLYYYDNLYKRPEVILSKPFTVGKTWQRYSTSKGLLDSNSVIGINGDNYYIKYNDSSLLGGDNNSNGYQNPFNTDTNPNNDNGRTYKNFPSSGNNSFEILDIGDITLNNGVSYSNCIKIGNENGEYKNYYWYAPNVGLVKYVIADDNDTYPNGRIEGEKVQGWNY